MADISAINFFLLATLELPFVYLGLNFLAMTCKSESSLLYRPWVRLVFSPHKKISTIFFHPVEACRRVNSSCFCRNFKLAASVEFNSIHSSSV